MHYAELVLAGHIAWFKLLAAAGLPSRRTTGALAVTTGVSSNVDNGVVVDPAIVDIDELEGVLQWLRSSGKSASCALGAPARPALVAQLVSLGLRADNSANVMGRSLVNYEPPAAHVDDYEVREVLSDDVLGDGMAASDDGWYDAEIRRSRLRVHAAVGQRDGSRVRHWVARRAGRTVAIATMFRFGRTAELAQCDVAPAHRRRGIARALTGARLRAAIAGGATAAVLSPSQDGYLLHRRLGFSLVPALRDRWFHVEVAMAETPR